MVKYLMNDIERENAADGPVVSEGGRSPSTLSTGQVGTAPGRRRGRARWRRASAGARRASARWCCA
jgi:hypothetical protein